MLTGRHLTSLSSSFRVCTAAPQHTGGWQQHLLCGHSCAVEMTAPTSTVSSALWLVQRAQKAQQPIDADKECHLSRCFLMVTRSKGMQVMTYEGQQVCAIKFQGDCEQLLPL